MTLKRITDAFSTFIDLVAEAVLALGALLHASGTTRLVEGPDGSFTLEGAGDTPAPPPFRLDASPLPPGLAAALKEQEVELALQPGHFLFRPLELPRRAGEFLDGIVRAQIDRLTPWNAADAVFGWTAPAPLGDDRIALTVAATARGRIAPLVEAVKTLGAKTIAVSTLPVGADAPIRVHAHTTAGTPKPARVRRILTGTLAGAGLAALLALLLADVAGGSLDRELDDLNRQIAARRLVLTTSNGGEAGRALATLERRKHEGAPTVLVLDALAEVLPDHTFVTEMHVEGLKLQVMGVSQDAPALIRLMEQSRRFTRATFFAPTTRAAEEAGERFHIEAQIRTPFGGTP
ncbi:PilN domain-containing protein [Xanthobacter autotrophicus DSM 431]|uniref:PilN domain-containing protein n=1 Tax=Xanthobacter nonsaccharivorans TaxID=3119912 RepID=UPI003729C624